MENEIIETEETMEVVEEVAKTASNKGWWIAAGAAVAGALTFVGIKVFKALKAKKAKKEEAEGDEDWAEELDSTVKEIKNEDID